MTNNVSKLVTTRRSTVLNPFLQCGFLALTQFHFLSVKSSFLLRFQIYVIDSADRKRFEETGQELQELLCEEKLVTTSLKHFYSSLK
jgi:hypothetical protein